MRHGKPPGRAAQKHALRPFPFASARARKSGRSVAPRAQMATIGSLSQTLLTRVRRCSSREASIGGGIHAMTISIPCLAAPSEASEIKPRYAHSESLGPSSEGAPRPVHCLEVEPLDVA